MAPVPQFQEHRYLDLRQKTTSTIESVNQFLIVQLQTEQESRPMKETEIV